jgi:DNA-binding transcriptional MerR regulator
MRIGELARQVGISTDTVRFYERSGLLPRPARRENDYREYAHSDAEHLRLLIDLRRLDLPLEDAARIASWCHSGHCAESTAALPTAIAGRRADIASRIEGLRVLDSRLADLERHLLERRARRELTVLNDQGLADTGVPCCTAADLVVGAAESSCACCTTSN